jgi:hypothetical protein
MRAEAAIEVAPVAIGPKNAEVMAGVPWRWIIDHADELGIEFITVGAKRVVMADELRRALEGRRAANPEPEVSEETELEAMRRRLGKVRRA